MKQNRNTTGLMLADSHLKSISNVGDATWIISNAFIILTMQTGFGMVEVGCVSPKNVANIMVKNVVDVTLGGIMYWIVGYGISFGHPATPFCGMGNFFATAHNAEHMGEFYTHYIFHFTLASAATTIVSGAVAERMKFKAYMIFAMGNIFAYCFPACWVWGPEGFLKTLGFYDFAGACVVHLTGGTSALVAAWMLGPRIGRFGTAGSKRKYPPSSPVTSLTGTFMLWWAWLSFNSGSTLGISKAKWKLAAVTAVNTINSSIGGSIAGIILSAWVSWRAGDMYFDVSHMSSSLLAGLIGVTASCSIVTPCESLFIGGIAAVVTLGSISLVEKLKIDDPVNAISVHLFAAIWATLAVGLFGYDRFELSALVNSGLFHGGGLRQLGVQMLGIICIGAWSLVVTWAILLCIKHTVGIRMNSENEWLGADWVEHRHKSEDLAMKLEQALAELEAMQLNVEKIIILVLAEVLKGPNQHVDSRIINFTVPEDKKNRLLSSSRSTKENSRTQTANLFLVAGTAERKQHDGNSSFRETNPISANNSAEKSKTKSQNFLSGQWKQISSSQRETC